MNSNLCATADVHTDQILQIWFITFLNTFTISLYKYFSKKFIELGCVSKVLNLLAIKILSNYRNVFSFSFLKREECLARKYYILSRCADFSVAAKGRLRINLCAAPWTQWPITTNLSPKFTVIQTSSICKAAAS